MVTTGIYGHIRHPQYTGFLLITLGMGDYSPFNHVAYISSCIL
ncbi:isoprenylcysteine carboxylmethyltransferase family protein [Clostridioides difficile]